VERLMTAIYRYRDDRGRIVQAPVRGRPAITVRRRARGWKWRLSIKTLSPTGEKERHDINGEEETEQGAIDAAQALLGSVVKELKSAKARLVKATQYTHNGVIVDMKRDCTSGRFVPSSSVVNNCVLPVRKEHVPWWRDTRPVKRDQVCYPTRAEALRSFADANRHAIDRAGGMDQVSSDGAWDAVNERFGLKGKRRVRSVRQALEAVMPPGRPYCLDRLDLETLNETRPAQEAGGFRLPDFVEEHKWLQREYAEHMTNEGDHHA
jgi:hypothetical protein